MIVSWGVVHRNRKIGPLFGRSFAKCFAVISGLYIAPWAPFGGPLISAIFVFFSLFVKFREIEEIRCFGRFWPDSQDLARSWESWESWLLDLIWDPWDLRIWTPAGSDLARSEVWLEVWLEVWTQSSIWELRGRSAGSHMAQI